MTEFHEAVASGKPPVAAKPVRFQTLADLLRDAYGSKRKRLAVGKPDLAAMRSSPRPDAEQLEHLLQLATSDRTLERTRELLLLSVDRLAHDPLGKQVREFAREVLRRHPAYRSRPLHGVLENLPEAVGLEGAAATLAALSAGDLHWPEGTPPLKKSEHQALRLAAVHCLLIWARETRGISLDAIQDLLLSACWATAGRKSSDGKALRTLVLSRDRMALGIACSMLDGRVKEKAREAAAARSSEERARVRADRLQSELSEACAHLVSATTRNDELKSQIDRERREHEDEKAHMRDQYEELRGRVLRRLRQEVALLDEGLHALRRQPPKLHVMDDHAERAIDGLKNEIERIKEDGE